MGKVKQIERKNRTYYFYNIINLKCFDINLLKIDKKHYKEINIYYIRYIAIKKIDDCENIYSVNPLYLLINHASGYIEEKMEINTWFLMILLMKTKHYYADVWGGHKIKINAINGGEEITFGKDYMKIIFNSEDDLPLNKPPKFHAMTIIIRFVLEEGGKLYPQVFLDDTLY